MRCRLLLRTPATQRHTFEHPKAGGDSEKIHQVSRKIQACRSYLDAHPELSDYSYPIFSDIHRRAPIRRLFRDNLCERLEKQERLLSALFLHIESASSPPLPDKPLRIFTNPADLKLAKRYRGASDLLADLPRPGKRVCHQHHRLHQKFWRWRNSFLDENELASLGLNSVARTDCLISRLAQFYDPGRISIGNSVRIDDFCILSGNIRIGSYVHISAYSVLYGSKGIDIEDYSGVSARVTIYSSADDFSGDYLINPMISSELTNVTGGRVHLEDTCSSVPIPS